MRASVGYAEEMTDSALSRVLMAEFIGTFALVFFGCGAAMVDGATGALGHGGVAATFGLVIAVMVYATGHLSGAHFNPAVTVAFATLRALPSARVLPYVVAQALAATSASMLLVALLGDAHGVGATVPVVDPMRAFAIEVVATFTLMFVITAVATDTRAPGATAGLAIGATVALVALAFGPMTGASMNPARSLGPALVSGVWDALWIYLVAPVVGAVPAAWAYRFVASGGADGGRERAPR